MMPKIFLSFLLFLISLNIFADSVDEFVELQLKQQKIPGMSIAILKDNTIVKIAGYGFSNIEHQVPAKPETIYQSGSLGKQFTAAAAMMLVEDGKIHLDDPVTKYFQNTPKSWKKITVHHLLTHTSGIPDYTAKDVDFRKEYTEDDLLKILMKLPLEFQPGDKWNYSNSGYMLLGFLIHKASGKFYGDVLEERIFAPLGMTTAQVISESDVVPNRAAGYELKDDKIKNQDWVSPSLNTTADGALYLTALDMSHWAEGLNGNQLMKPESFKQMWTPVKLNNGTSYPYGFGWRIGYQRGHRVIEHSGHWQGFSTGICRYPDFGLTVIMLANLADLSSLTIAEEIAGIHEPQLQRPHSLEISSSSSDPQLAEVLRQMLIDVGKKKTSKSLMPAFQSTLDKDTSDKIGKNMKEMKSFDFIGCDAVKEPMELFGGEATQYCYYRLTTSKETRTLVAGITADTKVTEFSLSE
jgi:CubicO group peptidase (beta-lactamase class C family)